MMRAGEAVEVARIVRDAFEQGDVALAIWLAMQHAADLEVAASVPSLVGEPVSLGVGTLRYTRRGLIVSPWIRVGVGRQNQLAMQAAVDAATAAGGGTIHIPAGYFELSSEIRCNGGVNLLFIGAPQRATTLARPQSIAFRPKRLPVG